MNDLFHAVNPIRPRWFVRNLESARKVLPVALPPHPHRRSRAANGLRLLVLLPLLLAGAPPAPAAADQNFLGQPNTARAHPADTPTATTPRTRRILYNLDGDSCMTLRAGRTGPGPITAADLTNLVAEITRPGSQLDTVLVCVNAQVMYYPTAVGTLRGTRSTPEERARWSSHERQRFANLDAFFAQGLDPYAVLFAEARRCGLETLLTFRMNDAHGNDFLRTAFWERHPGFRLGKGALDFAHDAVRDHVFELIRETVRRYDVDGLELDFLRFPTFFKAGDPAENKARMNGLVRRVREFLDAESARRGRPLVLGVRAPSDYGRTRPTYAHSVAAPRACDVAEWTRSGWIDFLTVSDWLFNGDTLDLADWRRHVPGIPIYAAIQPETRPSSNPTRCEHCLGADGYRLAARERWADGADGIYLFNFFTAREWPEPAEPPFEVLSEIGEPRGITERIPILGWHSIPERELSLERFQELAGMGLTLSLMHYSPEGNLKALDLAARTGVRLFIGDSRFRQPGPELDEAVRTYRQHPALAGYTLKDEPSLAEFPTLAAARDALAAADPDPAHGSYVNLFPTYASPAQLGCPTYPEHLRRFVLEFRPQVLSFDHYPILDGGAVRPDYYQNLEWIRRAALDAGVPFWAFALACPHKPYPTPTAGHVRLQAWSNFAYGARALQYFTYWTPNPGTWDFHDAPIRLDGSRSPTYDLLRAFNRDVQACADVLLRSRVTAVFHTEPLPAGTTAADAACPFQTIEGGPALVGLHVLPDDRRYALVVNRSPTEPATLRLTLRDEVRRVSWEHPVAGARLHESTNRVATLALEPGAAALLRIHPAP
ncbi:MAG: hypothetical protein AB7O66_13445 [Limisphaerales bacterium]